MPFTFHRKFLAGSYGALADEPPGGAGHEASRIGALSFLGRIEEAETLLARLEAARGGTEPVTVARFFLGVGHTRRSDYARARRAFARNEKGPSPTPLERFFRMQGRVFYTYYTGRFRASLRYAREARRLALRSGDLFARFLATDSYGHCRVVAGEIHHGLRLLEEARSLALRLGNPGLANASAISIELYRAEYGLAGADALAALERRYEALGTEDNYSLANVGLELARQRTRRGRFLEARQALERAAPAIYGNQNRRQEIQLNLRLAELAFRQGDHFSARHHLQFLHRLLHNEADSSYELAALGLARKIALAEGREQEAVGLLGRWRELARDFGNTRDDNLRVRLGLLRAERGNPEDRVHALLQASRHARSLPARLRPLLESGLLCEAADCLGLAPGKPILALLPGGLGHLAQSESGLSWSPDGAFSPLQLRILRLLAAGEGSKERLVREAWGYRYDPLRHDPVVYAAMSALRRGLGGRAEWLQVTESGYRFAAGIRLSEADQPAPSSAPVKALAGPLASLNHRQLEILDWLREERFLGVGHCRERFQVSTITALRDLSGLFRLGLVVRMGNARATRYSLAPEGPEGPR